MKSKNDGHRERLRNKFIEHGLDKFTDEEIIELLLTFGTPRSDCKQMARQMLKQFGTLRGVFEADAKELMEISGVGPSNSFGIKFIHQITRKFLREKMIGRPFLQSSEEALEYLNHAMGALDNEVFMVIYLNAGNEIINEETIAVGTATEVPVSPRQIAERAIKNGAVSLVLAHNHPGGSVEPSPEDRSFTKETLFVCGMMGLKLAEHLIISPNGHYSFSVEGHLADYERDFKRLFSKIGG
jgi:DNA repair protein RadC